MRKIIILLLIANLQFGCSHFEISPQGFKSTNMNMSQVTWTPTRFHADNVNASTPLNSTWRGINGAIDRISTGVAPFAIPGSGTVPALIKGGVPTISHFINPTTPVDVNATR